MEVIDIVGSLNSGETERMLDAEITLIGLEAVEETETEEYNRTRELAEYLRHHATQPRLELAG